MTNGLLSLAALDFDSKRIGINSLLLLSCCRASRTIILWADGVEAECRQL